MTFATAQTGDRYGAPSALLPGLFRKTTYHMNFVFSQRLEVSRSAAEGVKVVCNFSCLSVDSSCRPLSIGADGKRSERATTKASKRATKQRLWGACDRVATQWVTKRTWLPLFNESRGNLASSLTSVFVSARTFTEP